MRPRHLLALVLAFAGSARAAGSLNVVTAVEVKDEGTAVVLHVTGSRAPNFTTFSMADPPRFVIDLSEARFQGVPEDMVVRDGVVNLVKNLSYGSDATSIARIMVAFQLDVDPPDVQAAGNTLVVRIAKPARAAAAVATDDGAKAREAERKAQEEAARAAAETKAHEETARAAAEAKAQEEAARAAAEAKAQEEAARAAAEATAQEDAKRAAEAQARVDTEKAETVKEAATAAEQSRADAQSAEEARAAYEKERQAAVARAEEEAQARARAEADAREAEAQARADAERKAKDDAAAEARAAAERELAATNAPSRAPAAAEPAASEATPAIVDAPAVAHASADALDVGAPSAQLREVGFRQLPGASRVYVRTSVTPRFSIQDVGENVIRVELENTRATRRNDLRHLDTSFFPSAVAVVTPARRGASYVLDIKLRERVPYQQRIEGDMLAIDFERPAAPGTLPVAGPGGTMPAEGGAERVPAALEGEAEAAPAAN
jgi:colicin import membrane protein